jgi:transcriptional regulator GlxA family with amidase domain
METDMPKIEPGLPTPAEPDIDPIVAMALEAATLANRALRARTRRAGTGRKCEVNDTSRVEPMSWKLRRAINYVEVNLAEPLRSYQLAKIAGLSKAHFSRVFKATTGLTPNRFVMNRRLDCAVELLSASDKSLTDIATLCGFSDQSHFGRVFKRTLGLTPGAWRRSRTRARKLS